MSLYVDLAQLLLLLVILCPIIAKGSKIKRSESPSAVSFKLCEDGPLERQFRIEVTPISNPSQKLTAKFEKDGDHSKTLDGNIRQNDVKFVKYKTRNANVCFHSLVVDTTIIIAQPTILKQSCEEGDSNSQLQCKEWCTELHPVPICSEALTKLLNCSESLKSMPKEISRPNVFTPPEYDIKNDMAQASKAIAEGTAESFRKVVKHKWNALDDAKKVKFSDIGRKLGSFNGFMKALGPMFSIFSGITSIITTFLTPNPFDELAKYLHSEFKEIHRRLSHIQSDIADVKRVVENQGSMAGMAGKLEAIRYSLRRYEKMVKKLSEEKVCGAGNLFNRTEVRHFMEQYQLKNVDDSLLDLFGVEFGEVLESPSLLKNLMRAYCNTNKVKAKNFIEGVMDYAFAGNLAHVAYQSLECQKEGRQNCDYNPNKEENKEWNLKLYRFLKKANALKEAISDPGLGLQMDIQDEIDKLIYSELKNNPKNFDDVIFNVVFDFITNKLKNINDWPEACMYNLENKMIIVELAQLDDDVKNYNRDMKPWYLQYKTSCKKVKKIGFRVKPAKQELYTERKLDKDKNQADFRCSEKYYKTKLVPKRKTAREEEFGEQDCCVYFSEQAPDSHDWIISILFNPNSYKIAAKNKQNEQANPSNQKNDQVIPSNQQNDQETQCPSIPPDDQATPSVFVTWRPIFVYFTSSGIIRDKFRYLSYLTISKSRHSRTNTDSAFIDPIVLEWSAF